MAVYTDGKHLVAENVDELHDFAAAMGLKPEWFQDHRHPHYDLTTARAARWAEDAGAVRLSTRDIIRILGFEREWRRRRASDREVIMPRGPEFHPIPFEVKPDEN